jgi:sugar lactone lactonase YvrE
MGDRREIAVEGLKFPEGPRWRDGVLWLSDQLGGKVRRIVGEQVDVVAEIERPSGLGFLTDGSLLVASMSTCQVLRVDGNNVKVHADLSAHAAHLNDMYVDKQGRAYVDAYGEDWNAGDILLVDGERPVHAAAKQLAFPNGVAVTPDGSTLLIAETFGACITAFDVAGDGSLSGRRVWAPLPDRMPDGLCLDAEGAVWVASYLTGEFVRVREGGEVTDRHTVDGRWAMACALGGDDGRTLFLCSAETDQDSYFRGEAVGHLETVWVEVPGVGRP